ncbi:hypothetical protein COT99_00990 [Candidatus Falkowbacteria bacterium CG10_big_fil_rev_8_21_14_0_10_43_10]|uniref:DUF5698 domain-containing protein n=1 Tax=Candidatus Falkowbacteria bacterium CG10_big_fil_rev_8_21_14_0_10_43_10 TaxID=1974567 RepID=A0A2H0V2V8_9BACT|nr:MAG: hypothetical protein COT99_00990 [Candidatus Falkowbacteria bacterium CG10_big_fil_rev_8_21_14_0_10_43_10]
MPQGLIPCGQGAGFIYFIAGVCQDFLLTLNWRFINKEKSTPAAFFSFAVTIVSMLVLYNILTELDERRSIIAIIIYALGIGTGTILGMKTKIGSKKK